MKKDPRQNEISQITKIITATAILSAEKHNQIVKEVMLPNNERAELNFFGSRKIERTFIDAITGAGRINAEQREEKLYSLIKRENKETDKTVVSALSAAASHPVAKNKSYACQEERCQ